LFYLVNPTYHKRDMKTGQWKYWNWYIRFYNKKSFTFLAWPGSSPIIFETLDNGAVADTTRK
jgi:hypothetical protein